MRSRRNGGSSACSAGGSVAVLVVLLLVGSLETGKTSSQTRILGRRGRQSRPGGYVSKQQTRQENSNTKTQNKITSPGSVARSEEGQFREHCRRGAALRANVAASGGLGRALKSQLMRSSTAFYCGTRCIPQQQLGTAQAPPSVPLAWVYEEGPWENNPTTSRKATLSRQHAVPHYALFHLHGCDDSPSRCSYEPCLGIGALFMWKTTPHMLDAEQDAEEKPVQLAESAWRLGCDQKARRGVWKEHVKGCQTETCATTTVNMTEPAGYVARATALFLSSASAMRAPLLSDSSGAFPLQQRASPPSSMGECIVKKI